MPAHVLKIADRDVGGESPVFVIAEAGINHNGSIETAKEMIAAAAQAGADAVKFQTFTAQKLLAINSASSLFELFRSVELPLEAYQRLKDEADSNNIIFLSTPFDFESLDFLVSIGMPAIKIASSDLTFLPLLEKAGATGLPIILSTGMGNIEEIEIATKSIKSFGNSETILLHATIAHPAPHDCLNLAAIRTMQEHFDLNVGYSDHTGSEDVLTTAVALGAKVVETHFTLDKTMSGPDHVHSIEPSELKNIIAKIRRTEDMLGDGNKACLDIEEGVKKVVRRVMVARKDMKKGSILKAADVAYKRGIGGISPLNADTIIGKTLLEDIPAEKILKRESFS